MRAETDSPNLKRLAENLWEYEPTTVLWEPDGSLRAYTGAALRSAMTTAQADNRAPVALYDAFRAPDNKHVIVVQAIEDTNHPRDLKFYCGDKLMPHQEVARRPGDRTCAIQQIQANIPPPETLRMTMEASGHSVEIDILPNPFADWRKVALTQVLIQKDYPMMWIRDHALFYHRAHGYERLVVYDNGGSNIAELKDCLAQLDEGLQVLLIRWPFPMHRPHLKYDTHTQVAALNHHLHLLASRSTYISHFDLDEYLLNRARKPLTEYLDSYLTSQNKDALHVWTERVANVTKQARSDPVRAANFRWQSRDVTNRLQWGYKIIYRAKPLLPKNFFLGAHEFSAPKRNPGIQSSEVQDSKIRKLDIKEKPFFRRLIYRPLSKLRQWVLGQSRIQIRTRQLLSRLLRVYPPNLYLFHYDGIRTNWSDDNEYQRKRLQRLPWNPLRYKRNDEMPKLLKRIGLADEDD